MTDSSTSTLIRVPASTRDRVREAARAEGVTFGQIIDHGLDLVERERFWERIGAIDPDPEYRRESDEWDAWADADDA